MSFLGLDLFQRRTQGAGDRDCQLADTGRSANRSANNKGHAILVRARPVGADDQWTDMSDRPMMELASSVVRRPSWDGRIASTDQRARPDQRIIPRFPRPGPLAWPRLRRFCRVKKSPQHTQPSWAPAPTSNGCQSPTTNKTPSRPTDRASVGDERAPSTSTSRPLRTHCTFVVDPAADLFVERVAVIGVADRRRQRHRAKGIDRNRCETRWDRARRGRSVHYPLPWGSDDDLATPANRISSRSFLAQCQRHC
uniref:Uncharacterized protein n=1 Tax=Plectus sambesii TaxID=2011161 RepID=A0A914XB55_9BILA